jgi:hypothetical protein
MSEEWSSDIVAEEQIRAALAGHVDAAPVFNDIVRELGAERFVAAFLSALDVPAEERLRAALAGRDDIMPVFADVERELGEERFVLVLTRALDVPESPCGQEVLREVNAIAALLLALAAGAPSGVAHGLERAAEHIESLVD